MGRVSSGQVRSGQLELGELGAGSAMQVGWPKTLGSAQTRRNKTRQDKAVTTCTEATASSKQQREAAVHSPTKTARLPHCF